MFSKNKRDVNAIADYPEILKGINGLSADKIKEISERSSSAENKDRVLKEVTDLVKNG